MNKFPVSADVWAVVKDVADQGAEVEDVVLAAAPLIAAETVELVAARLDEMGNPDVSNFLPAVRDALRSAAEGFRVNAASIREDFS